MAPYNFIHDFTDNEIEILNKYRDKQNNSRLKIRFPALILLALRTDMSLIASALGKTVITIKNWHYQYVSEGIDSFDSFSYKPKQGCLNFFQINQVVIYAKFENSGKVKQIKNYIQEKFNVDYIVESVRKILKKHGLEVIKPKIHPGSPPAVEEQQVFIKQYNEQKQTDPPGSVRLFIDAMHLIHQNIPGRCRGIRNFLPSWTPIPVVKD